jgi:DNA-binding transcriptional ArsR family regulator
MTGVADVAVLLGDRSRAAMCEALMDGRAWTVSELAAHAGVGKACASEHVGRLVGAGLVTSETQGRCRYVRLAGPEVAAVLEGLARLAEPPAGARSLGDVRRRAQFAAARTCYDHLAGRLGVAVHDALVRRRLLRKRDGLLLTRSGRSWFVGLGIDVEGLERRERPLLRECTDLTERAPHLAGGLGAALCERFLVEGWVRRTDRSRALVVTAVGERALEAELGVGPVDVGVSDRAGRGRPRGSSSTPRGRAATPTPS